MSYIAARNICCRLAKLEKIENKLNVYKLERWEDFVRKPNFISYTTLVGRLRDSTNRQLVVPEVPGDKRFASIVSTRTD